MGLTAKDIQRRILADCYRRRTFACPNYTPKDWWECDVFELTKTGRFREFEVKLTRADFKADRWKADRQWDLSEGWANAKTIHRKKHELLAAGETIGPTQFWFVTPVDLISGEELPKWAGLIWAHETKRKAPWNVHLDVMRQAPKLHTGKTEDAVRNHLLRT
jgi:hypothetical protein